MNKFEVGERVMLVQPDAADVVLGDLHGGMEGVVVGVAASTLRVRLDDGRLFYFSPDQLEHAPQEAHQERRERIATAVLAGFAADPDQSPNIAGVAAYAVQWADALIKELDK